MYGSSIYVDQLKLLNISLFEYIRYTMGIWVISLTISLIKVRSCISIDRRKFRNQNSDSMDRWKAEVGIHGGKSQRREEKRSEEKKREDQRREGVRRKKIQAREKAGKSRNTVFFQWFVAPEGRKVGSLKRRVRSHLARWEMKNCTPLWCEAHFQVKMYKTHHVPTTFGSWDVQKVHAVVARSTFRSQKWEKLRGSEHFWTFRCRFAWRGRHKGFFTLPKMSKTWGTTATSETQYFEVIYFVYIVSGFFYTFLLLPCFLPSFPTTTFSFSRFFLLPHPSPSSRLWGKSCISSPSSSAPWFCSNDTLFTLVMLYWRRQCRIHFLLPRQLLTDPFHFEDFIQVFWRLTSSSVPASRLCSCAHSTPCSRLRGESCTSSPTTPSPFLPERFYSPWMSGPTTVLLTWPVNSIEDQLKLAGAARGVPGGHGQQNFFHYWMPTYYSPKRD